jgi:hypothetical protein
LGEEPPLTLADVEAMPDAEAGAPEAH